MKPSIDFTFPPLAAGQLSPSERKVLYDYIKGHRPKVCVECGTWSGLGSTYFLAQALKENEFGHLHTFDAYSVEMHGRTPAENLRHYDIGGRVDVYLEDFIEGLQRLELESIDFAFLDGPESSFKLTETRFSRFNKDPIAVRPPTKRQKVYYEVDYTLETLLCLEKSIPRGGVVFLHDWEMLKCAGTKKYIQSSQENWDLGFSLQSEMGLAQLIRK